MTNEEILKIRKDCRDDVSRPGKFEGCAAYAPYFYNLMLEGCYHEDHGKFFSMQVDEQDLVIFPELKTGKILWFYQSDQGFIYEIDEPSEEELAEAYDDDGWGGPDDSEDECRYCGGNCPNESKDGDVCDGYAGDIDGLYEQEGE